VALNKQKILNKGFTFKLSSILYAFLLLLFPSVNSLYSQQLKQQFDEVYSMDPILYNGRVFSDLYRTGVDGTQFFNSENFSLGDLKLNQRVFTLQELNYEVFAQKLLLSFTDKIKAKKIIEIPLEHVQYFYLRSKYFEIIEWSDNTYKIFQVISSGEYKLLIFWYKILVNGAQAINNQQRFSDLKSKIWMLKDDDYYPIKNNKSIITLFQPEQQPEIKKWLKSNGVKVQKADDKDLQMLINYLSLK
jgi:hypothetical protein